MEALTEVESEVIGIEEGGKESSCLVGRLVSKENWNPSDLIQALKRAWEPKHGMSWRKCGGSNSKRILFRFDDAMDRDWVLLHQPWHFNGYLFTVKKCRGDEHVITIKHAPYWVRLYDVPNWCITEISIRRFAKQIGKLESVDKSGEDSVGTFLRFKFSINITRPLMRGISVRVKGKHLWLPLKYESLPIYCFCCGTIGHRHKNCSSHNRNLEYSTCELRATEEQKSTPTIPHDIIENILSCLPAKSLLRFKVVSKKWNVTISDPRFAEIHLQQCKNSSSRDLLAWEQHRRYKGLCVSKIQNDQFQFVSRIQQPEKYSSAAYNLCACDGLYLKCFNTPEGKAYLLWNPSCRSYKEIRRPREIYDTDVRKTYYGIYYNPQMKDYKVVIAAERHYAVFSCRYNEWREVKEMKDISYNSIESWNKGGVSFKGSLYWLMHGEENIICFDGEVEKFQKLPMPNYGNEKSLKILNLTSSRSLLCLFVVYYNGTWEKMRMWKKVEKDSWKEYELQLKYDISKSFYPVCWLNEDEILMGVDGNYLLYDTLENTSVVIQPSHRITNFPFIYQENIFLQ